ncbi:UDP-N-acetylmuramoyl-L-alanine--D-glutamate ligase [Rhizobium sp. CFBP 8762]|uniref:UDP-N-acetylmuramoyl-L-alanine--D-glutamate ligase n=1 Tax=Rhizobium sp. CFBP 8762 TaxID=2775279 RepID=UPI00177A9418|nr:UDP-N-acetylmuramoyl-L-alanine--D-glutamate ligase [Rhizobium sp. CFBP 8762]MBD8554822.1 UDP-N-acetylmuramoyl-L-alanine--D-glutamate ligase [Rhizobium sp. CFBP 8762]
MIAVSTFSGKTVALFGLGGSGIATAQALVAGGARVVAWDDTQASVEKAASEGIPTGDLRDIDWASVSAFVLSPGVPLTHPVPHWSVDLARAAGVEIIGDVELFARERAAHAPDCPLIAITGTNGKSTTTALIAHILRSSGRDTQMGGNIGRAVLTLDPPKGERFYVIECSSYQIDLAPSLNPTVGILLNLTPDHLDRHGDMAGYAAIKERLVLQSDVAVVGVDDSFSSAIADRLSMNGHSVQRISRRLPVTDGLFADGPILFRAEAGAVTNLADLSGISTLRGSHNAQNACAAIAACLAVGVSLDDIIKAVADFPGLAHRMQPVAKRGRVVFVNDSKATNADATAPALSSYERIYWIAGGVSKEGGIASLIPLFANIARAYLIGRDADAFAETLEGAVPVTMSGTLEQAVAQAAGDAASDPAALVAVMLSPACASFDQYKNFEQRGEAFVSHVRALPNVDMLVRT